jgi:hypothetical protein
MKMVDLPSPTCREARSSHATRTSHCGIQQVIPVDPRDLGLVSGSGKAPKQRPFAAILGCSDARVPVELIFNEGPNDLFVVRVAGNGHRGAWKSEICS